MNPKRYIDKSARINMPFRFLQGCKVYDETAIKDTILPDEIYIGAFASIGKGVLLENGIVIDSYCVVEGESQIGKNTLITYKATIGGGAKIGNNCVIGGFISENTQIGNNCRIFGKIVHSHSNSLMSWDFHSVPEPAVKICDNCFVGFEAVISGGIEIGANSYICSGAIVTKSVPPKHIVFGYNNIVHYTKWKGNLKNNPLFELL